MTTVSMDSEAGADPEGRLADFREEEERCVYRSGLAHLRREAREIRISCNKTNFVAAQEWE